MMRTPSQTVGPFFAIGLCRRDQAALDPAGVELAGTLYDGQGEPVPDGVVELYDPETGAGYDGLHPGGRNENCGAESTLAALSTLQRARDTVRS